MGFLQRFYAEESQRLEHEPKDEDAVSSFDELSEEELESHMLVSSYGDFQLTDAVRPAFDLRVIPRQGYRHDLYEDAGANTKVPVLMVSASKEKLFPLFIDLLDPLGGTVDVVLETSHHSQNGHLDLYREQIDMPVLKSTLWDFEEMLLNDGCTGVAVLNPQIPQEIQFDEHKLLIVYGQPLEQFEEILARYGIERNDQLELITQAEHVHSSSEDLYRQFEELRRRLGMDEQQEAGSC